MRQARDEYERYLALARSLAAAAGVAAHEVPTRSVPADEGSFVEGTGARLALRYVERGAMKTIAAGDADALAYPVLRSITWSQAIAHELRHRRPGEDSRRQWMHDHVRRMAALRPEWGDATRAHYDEVLVTYPFDDAGTRRRERADELAMRGMCRSEAEAIARQDLPSAIRDEDRKLGPIDR
jgi:hypothetical protein